MSMFEFTFYCAKEKYNIYPIIYTYKLHAEVLEITNDNLVELRSVKNLENKAIIKKIERNILEQYDTEENINFIFKLLCESCNNAYPFADDVFTII